MITKELIDYIKSQRQNGVNDEAIKSNLLSNNWLQQDINQAFLEIDKEQKTEFHPRVFSQQSDSNLNEEEEKPKIIKILSNFFYFILCKSMI